MIIKINTKNVNGTISPSNDSRSTVVVNLTIPANMQPRLHISKE